MPGGPPQTFDLRPEVPSDEAFTRRLFASTRAGELAALSGAPAALEAFLQIQIQAQRRGYEARYPGAAWSIIVVADAPVGRLIVGRSGADLRLVDIAFLPEHRGGGLGTRILTALRDEAGLAGRRIALHVLRESPAARLYARLGFVRTGGTEVHDEMVWSPPR